MMSYRRGYKLLADIADFRKAQKVDTAAHVNTSFAEKRPCGTMMRQKNTGG
jgi:hypothetical protein